MKTLRYYIIPLVILVMISLLVLPVSASWPFDDITSWGNSVYQYIVTIPTYIQSSVGYLVMVLLYPFVLLLNILWKDLTYLLNSVIAFLNIWITLPKTLVTFFQAYTPSTMPSIWVQIFVILFGVNSYLIIIQVIKIAKHFYQLLPAYFGGG